VLQGAESSDSSSYDDEQVENNPELHPLKEALLRARRRREEATGVREALEAEAQQVAQLAVNAEAALNKAKKQLDEATADLAAATAAADKLRAGVSDVEARMAEAGASALASGDFMDAAPGFMAAREGGISSDEGDSDLEGVASLEDALWRKGQALDAAAAAVGDAQARIAALQAKVAAAEEGYGRADAIAGAAMEAAEEAVRAEMECITVGNETESALLKAIDDLKFLDDSSERREESFDSRKSRTATLDEADEPAAAAAASAKALAGAAAAAATAANGMAPPDLEAAPKPLLQQALALALRHRYAALACAALAAAGGLALYQTGALAALGAKAQAAAAAAARLWAVAADLASRLPLPHVHESEKGILETIWLLLASVITVPLVCKIPGGSPVLGFLAGGALIGPYALGIIQDVESIRHLAELGVVFLLFNIGLELSFDRLASMGKFVFGMGTAQVVITLAAVAYTALALAGGSLGGPGAIILGGGLALSTTAVGMQVLQDRGETGSRHGRAAFSVLLLQDLAVVVLLMLIPLLAPGPDGATGGLGAIARAIGFASVKAVVCMASIVVAGRTLLQPLYRRVADTNNAELFAALTLLVVLGTSLITQVAGLSLALGAFLAGLLLAETEFHIQVESDIAPYKGLLMGLFFMTVGMEISMGLLLAKFKVVLAAMVMLICGKVAIMAAVGQAFGLSLVQSLRAGLLLSPGGEFAFVLFGEAVGKGLLGAALVKELYLVVALSMALTPFLAQFGARLARLLEKSDMKALAPKDSETAGLSGHVILAGFGRVGQLIAQMLGEELIPFVALDLSAARVQEGKANDLPVYFGDAGSPAVLHSLGADRAACAVITLDTPSANYRSVWAMHKNFPHVKTFCRAHAVSAGIMLERAGATAVVPELLEPSLQLAAAVLSELSIPEDDVAETIRNFRKRHLSELQVLAQLSGSSLGYGKREAAVETGGEEGDDAEEAPAGPAVAAA
jgi:monovalent cation:proton antiporter-2 (CPA2) family protein